MNGTASSFIMSSHWAIMLGSLLTCFISFSLELWGYKRVEEIIWVKTNQLQRIIRTGRTGHWLNHSKEHCLVGLKGNPEVNRNIDTDVIVAEVRETSRKPDEVCCLSLHANHYYSLLIQNAVIDIANSFWQMYPMLERISPRTRKLELFARMHNTHAGYAFLLSPHLAFVSL